MGGKNAVIVDSDADLDDVVPALLKSAFAFAGPEVLRRLAARWSTHAIADELAERLAGAITTLRVGPAADFGTDVPPVIDIAAQQRIQRYIDSATPLAQAETRDDGFYVAADDLRRPAGGLAGHPRGDLRPGAQRSRPCRASSTPATLVDAVARSPSPAACSRRSPRTIEYVSERTPVGNLYVNREITGAMVGRQPFGGGTPVRHRPEGRRPRLPAAVRRGPRGHREHRPPRPRRLTSPLDRAHAPLISSPQIRRGLGGRRWCVRAVVGWGWP